MEIRRPVTAGGRRRTLPDTPAEEKKRSQCTKSQNAAQDIALSRYSRTGRVECECCGETQRDMLTLDHINGDGAEQRRENKGKAGKMLAVHLRARGWPDQHLRVLCQSCNMSARYSHTGTCSHQRVFQHVLTGGAFGRDPLS